VDWTNVGARHDERHRAAALQTAYIGTIVATHMPSVQDHGNAHDSTLGSAVVFQSLGTHVVERQLVPVLFQPDKNQTRNLVAECSFWNESLERCP